MPFAVSADRTQIDYVRTGSGPAVILVPGALATRSHPDLGQLADLLAPDFTVICYDRRGRGKSTDTAPYAVAREIDDLAALIAVAGGAATLVGFSSGAALALNAAAALPGQVTAAMLYEPPFIVDDSFPPLPADYVDRLDAAIAAGDRDGAVLIFFRDAMHLPDEFLAPMQESPMWPEMTAVAHTIAYDGRVMGDTMAGQPFAPGQWSTATMPVLALAGGESLPFFATSGRALATQLPNARFSLLAGQNHGVAPTAIAPAIRDFLRQADQR